MAARRARRRVSRKRRTVRRRTGRRVSRKRKTSRRRVVRRRRKARKVSVRGSKVQVFRGSRMKTKTSGQTKAELMKNKRGKNVYKKNGLAKWTKAFMQARKNLGLKGFVACKK